MQFIEANGAKIPAIGLGTWELRGRTCARLVEQALQARLPPYRYRAGLRERARGRRGPARLRVRRDEVFVTTKIWTTHFAPNDLERSTKESLTKLRLSEVDLLLLHWPNPQVPLSETLGALAHVKKLGLARHIGVSNFTVALIDEAVAACPEPLVCDQVEYHPYLDQTKVREACARHGMARRRLQSDRQGPHQERRDAGGDRAGPRQDRRRRSACAGWCSRMSPRYRGPRRSSGCRKISRSSISRCPTTRWAGSPRWPTARGRLTDFGFAPKWD